MKIIPKTRDEKSAAGLFVFIIFSVLTQNSIIHKLSWTICHFNYKSIKYVNHFVFNRNSLKFAYNIPSEYSPVCVCVCPPACVRTVRRGDRHPRLDQGQHGNAARCYVSSALVRWLRGCCRRRRSCRVQLSSAPEVRELSGRLLGPQGIIRKYRIPHTVNTTTFLAMLWGV